VALTIITDFRVTPSLLRRTVTETRILELVKTSPIASAMQKYWGKSSVLWRTGGREDVEEIQHGCGEDGCCEVGESMAAPFSMAI